MKDNTKKNRKTIQKSRNLINRQTDRPTEKYLQNRCSYVRRIYTQKIGPLSYLQPEKITFPPKPKPKLKILIQK